MARITDLAQYAVNHLRHRGLRSLITVLGVVIGVAAIVTLIAIADGMSRTVAEQLETFGSQNIMVVPNGLMGSFSLGSTSATSSSGKLTENDAARLTRLPGVKTVNPSIIPTFITAKYQDQTIVTPVIGADPDFFNDIFPQINAGEGRLLRATDRHALLLGYNYADKDKSLFGKRVEVNSFIEMNGKKYRVAGIATKIGGPFNPDDDNNLYAPLEDARELAKGTLDKNELTMIYIAADDGTDTEALAEDIKAQMRASHKVKEGEEDFMVITAKYIQDQIGGVLNLLTIFLGAVAGISLLVGAIGIANAMFMAVLERTREIGTLKAIGAGETDIERLFLIESALIGLAGGLIGLGIGVALSFIITLAGFAVGVSLPLALGALAFSLIIGIASGYFPARNAARLDAIEALRYE